MSESIAIKREEAVDKLLRHTRAMLNSGELDREILEDTRQQLDRLAADACMWARDDYPDPESGEKQNRFRIGGESDDGITLYLNVMRPGKKINPHNHTTWACISAVSGVEHNTLYDRTDDGKTPGEGKIVPREIIALAPGNSLAMMPDDIHSVDIKGEDVIRHLHLYGQPLESLTGRKMYDMKAGTYKIMDIGVKTKG